jgi:hypothetical protein
MKSIDAPVGAENVSRGRSPSLKFGNCIEGVHSVFSSRSLVELATFWAPASPQKFLNFLLGGGCQIR